MVCPFSLLPNRATDGRKEHSAEPLADRGTTGNGNSRRGRPPDRSGPPDGSRGAASGNDSPTAVEIRAALENSPALMPELGLVWVEQTHAGRQAELNAAAVATAALQTELDALHAEIDKAKAAAVKVHQALSGETAASLPPFRKQCKTDVGYNGYQTALFVVAGAGLRSSDTAVAKRVSSLGILRETCIEAHARMQRACHGLSLSLPAILADGRYVNSERKTRSDATPSELQAIPRKFWHSDDVSHAPGKSGDGDMW